MLWPTAVKQCKRGKEGGGGYVEIACGSERGVAARTTHGVNNLGRNWQEGGGGPARVRKHGVEN